MVEGLSARRFLPNDFFLRRIDRKNKLRDGMISAEAFRCRTGEPSLSFTYQDETLKSEQAIDAYHRTPYLKSGDLPGICGLYYVDLTEKVWPPLPPRGKLDPDDRLYGHLHCETDCPSDEVQVQKLAYLAQEHGLVRPLVRKKERTDRPIEL